MTRRVGEIVAAGLLVACTPVEREHQTSSAAESDAVRVLAPEPDAPVVTILQTRDHEVTVYAAAHELRFTVAASGGTVLAVMLTADEFARSFPGLHQRYDSAFADDHSWVDASATVPTSMP